MKICIVSDSHDRAEPLLQAVQAACAAGAQAVLHCGDVIGGHTLRPLVAVGVPVHVVHGNNVGDTMAMLQLGRRSQHTIQYHGAEADIELAGRRIYLTHYPHLARGMACTGDYDLVCCGHSHAASAVRQANVRGEQTWLVNPGTVAGIGAPPTWILGDLESLAFDIVELKAA